MENKSILITGCSSGIGLCAATLLHKRGYQVFATARKPEDLAMLSNLGVTSLHLDVTDSESILTTVQTVSHLTNGKLYALFNNAGYLEAGAVEDLTRERIRKQFETNVFGPMELIRKILPLLRHNGKGRIIQNSSILGIITLPYCGAYNASKFALEGFTDTLRQELRHTNIQVVSINPGPIASHLRDTAYQSFQAANIESQNYLKGYSYLENDYFQNATQRSLGPEMVVKKLIHALESRRPHPHYFVGYSANILAILRRILPTSTLDWLLSFARK